MGKKILAMFLFSIFLITLFTLPLVFAEETHESHSDIPICGVYFTGIGCPHCAKVEPYIKDLLNKK